MASARQELHPLLVYLVENDLTQTEFARQVNVSMNTVNRWIREGMVPRGGNLRRIMSVSNGKLGPEHFVSGLLRRAA